MVRCAVAPSLAWRRHKLRGALPQAHALSSRTPCQDAPALRALAGCRGAELGIGGSERCGCRMPIRTTSNDLQPRLAIRAASGFVVC